MQTAATVENPSRMWKFREWLMKSRSWIGLLILAPFIGAALAMPAMTPPGSWAAWNLHNLGWLSFLAGAGLRWWSTLYIGARKTWDLVDAGPYSMCRNPIYLGTFLIGLSMAFFLESPILGAGIVLTSAIYLHMTVPPEEERLAAKLGERYQEYCRRVPRYWPRFATFNSGDKILFYPKGLYAEAVRMVRWICIPFLMELLSRLRAEGYWPLWQ